MTSKKQQGIGEWSLIKNEIIEKYARAYTTILTKNGFHPKYVDVFAGSPQNLVRTTGELVDGSAKRALGVRPAFEEFYFVDLDRPKAEELNSMADGRDDVFVFHGDANVVLRDLILPNLRWANRDRALMLLDPYGMGVAWDVVEAAGKSRCVEIILNFPTMAINRQSLRKDPKKVDPRDVERMNTWWGDRSWRTGFYRRKSQMALFDWISDEEKVASNEEVVSAYCERLKEIAGFGYTSKPFKVQNSIDRTIYYLVFATPNQRAHEIMDEILEKYRR